jgi:hypothetical protein
MCILDLDVNNLFKRTLGVLLVMVMTLPATKIKLKNEPRKQKDTDGAITSSLIGMASTSINLDSCFCIED